MLSIFDLIIGSAVFIGIGFLPIFLFLQRYEIKRNSIILISVGYAPVLLATLNIVVVSLGIQNSIFIYTVPIILWTSLLVFLKKKKAKAISETDEAGWLKPLLIGILFGCAYWFIAFPNTSSEDVRLNFDVIWNLGLVGELKNHFPPKDPHWYTGNNFIYHFLTNAYQAGLSNFTGFDTLTTLNIVNLFTSLSIFVLIALFVSRTSLVEGLVIFSLLLISSFTNEWTVFKAFHFHITNQAASTFFWSLPVFIASVQIWRLMNSHREKIPFSLLASVILISSVAVYFSKSSYVTVFVFLEFMSFIRFILQKKLWKISLLRENSKTFISFTLYPLFFFLFLLLSRSSSQASVFFGLEARDFSNFQSWNPIYPLAAFYLVSTVFVLFEIKRVRQIKWDFLICSLFNFALFFVLKHEGYSDLYFAFNAILLNAIFIIDSGLDNKLTGYVCAYLLCGVLIWYLAKEKIIQGFNSLDISFAQIDQESSNGRFSREELNEYSGLSKFLPANALMASPEHPGQRFFLYSAFLERRIWNECPIYGHGVINDYVPERLFLAQEKFNPDYLTDPPDGQKHDEAFERFKKDLIIDTIKFENPSIRYSAYHDYLFGNLSSEDRRSIAKRYGWTHVIVNTINVDSVNEEVRNVDKLVGKYITIFKIN